METLAKKNQKNNYNKQTWKCGKYNKHTIIFTKVHQNKKNVKKQQKHFHIEL